MPKSKGGLGVISLSLQNDALLMKHLVKFYNRADSPWVRLVWHKYYAAKVPHASREVGSFWWREIMRLNVLFRGVTKCTLGDGRTASFWFDMWLDDEILALKFPTLVSFAKSDDRSVYQMMHAEDLDSIFFLPLSTEAFDELQLLQDQLTNKVYNPQELDKWMPYWGTINTAKNFTCTPSKEWMHIHCLKQFGSQDAPPGSSSFSGWC